MNVDKAKEVFDSCWPFWCENQASIETEQDARFQVIDRKNNRGQTTVKKSLFSLNSVKTLVCPLSVTVRANMVVHPAEYRWSSYRANAQGNFSALLTPHPPYTSLASRNNNRQAAYRDLFRYQLEPGLVDEIRAATNGNYALGSPQFLSQIANALQRRVTPGKSGRPRKNQEPESLDLFGDS